jgi:uncharacterized protein (TIGR02996 family)
MTDGAALLRAVLVDPADDAPRLVYADWLEEHGEPGHAAFIRGQVRLAQPETRTDPRLRRDAALEEAVLRQDAARYGSLPDNLWVAGDWGWDRGFVRTARLPAAALLAHAAALFAAHPVARVFLTDRWPLLDPGAWGWHLPFDSTPMSEDPTILPAELFGLLEGMTNPGDPAGDEFAHYPDGESALAALSGACVRFGRVKAGLPPLSRAD